MWVDFAVSYKNFVEMKAKQSVSPSDYPYLNTPTYQLISVHCSASAPPDATMKYYELAYDVCRTTWKDNIRTGEEVKDVVM